MSHPKASCKSEMACRDRRRAARERSVDIIRLHASVEQLVLERVQKEHHFHIGIAAGRKPIAEMITCRGQSSTCKHCKQTLHDERQTASSSCSEVNNKQCNSVESAPFTRSCFLCSPHPATLNQWSSQTPAKWRPIVSL